MPCSIFFIWTVKSKKNKINVQIKKIEHGIANICTQETEVSVYLHDTPLCDKVCQWLRSVVFSGYSSFLHQQTWPPRYNWNIVESGVKNYHANKNVFCLVHDVFCPHRWHSWKRTTSGSIFFTFKKWDWVSDCCWLSEWLLLIEWVIVV